MCPVVLPFTLYGYFPRCMNAQCVVMDREEASCCTLHCTCCCIAGKGTLNCDFRMIGSYSRLFAPM